MREGRWRRWWPLAATAALVVLLAATNAVPTWPGLIHLVALPPLDQFTDLRILLSRASSWPAFLVLLAGVAAARVALMAWLLGGLDARRLRFAALFYTVAFGPVLLAAFADATAYAVLYSRLFWPAVALIGVLVLTLGPVPWQGGSRLRAAVALTWRRGLRVEVMLPYCAVILALGAVAERVPVLTVPLVPVSAVATGLAIRAMGRPALRRPGAVLTALVAVLAAASLVFVATRGYDEPEPGPPQPGSLLILSGINSASGRGAIHATGVHRLGYRCEQVYYFSYAGPGDGQPQRDATCPIRTGAPYGPSDTQRPFHEQVDLFVEQASALPRPLVVAAHSHAVWVVWEAVATGRVDVDALLLVGPFPSTPTGYPPPHVNAPGRVFGDLLRAAAPATDLVRFHFDPDTPAARELLGTAGAAESILAQPLPATVRATSLPAATDLPLMPDDWQLDVERNGCPARVAHPYLPRSAAFEDAAIRFLNGRPPPPCPPWRDWGAVLVRPFGVPAGQALR
ncbi:MULTISPECIES: hypothetical protein [Rhodococcus]|uniref:hypothetical protein n=1 Tax=Rhodococcus TaxID=1827 RepID=UPI000C9C5238|nr:MULTISPECIES: hypothetical protein [Rhodococcus]PND52018.1 hypothetical protein CQZ88_10885 [Rhodococcus sp. ENV425]USC17227.1 hypothetical protein KZJ41_10300 [Rhodococcus sp. 11-3]WKX00519.1 hypothetical protein Q3O43_09560 [Rhodococcus aetherivorans]